MRNKKETTHSTLGKQGECVKPDKDEEKPDKECCGGGCNSFQNETVQKLDLVNEECQGPTGEQEEELEKRFFLMYHLHMQWSEYDKMTDLEHDWTIQRFVHQKKMEKEIMNHQQRKSNGGILIPEPSLEF